MPRQASAEEEALRVAVESWMRQRWPAARIVHELNLAAGAQRIDLVSVGDEELRMVEIKSAKDVLTRLVAQVKCARDCAQEVWVAIDAKHLAKLEALEQSIPHGAPGWINWWPIGLLVFRDGEIHERRQAQNRQPDPREVVQLLWSDEMRTHLISGNNQATMIRRAVDEYGLRHIMRGVCKALKARPFPRADAPVGEPPKTRL
jgi:hypothetical protein